MPLNAINTLPLSHRGNFGIISSLLLTELLIAKHQPIFVSLDCYLPLSQPNQLVWHHCGPNAYPFNASYQGTPSNLMVLELSRSLHRSIPAPQLRPQWLPECSHGGADGLFRYWNHSCKQFHPVGWWMCLYPFCKVRRIDLKRSSLAGYLSAFR